MSAIGFDIFSLASSVIGLQEIHHSKWKGIDEVNGIQTPVYYQPPARHMASVQPMPRDMIEKNGLDVQKSYITIYTEADLTVADQERGRGPDLVDFEGERYNVESNTPWVNQNGWKGSICCKVGRVNPC